MSFATTNYRAEPERINDQIHRLQ